mgnify:FL=1
MPSQHSVIATAINSNGVSPTLCLVSPSIHHCISAFVEYVNENDECVSIPAEFVIADNTPNQQIYTVEYYPSHKLLTIVSYVHGSTYKVRFSATVKFSQVIAQIDNSETVTHDKYFTQTFANVL